MLEAFTSKGLMCPPPGMTKANFGLKLYRSILVYSIENRDRGTALTDLLKKAN